ncbi:MAG: HD domain-containing protein, partial [bacterium]|nr:HD domain-containing protein [bacterium]
MDEPGAALLTDFPRAHEFIALIQDRIKPKTARHSISVAETMLSVADEAGIRPDQAVAAGLLHDLGKGMRGPELLEAAEELALPISDLQRDKPKLLHGPVAAALCRRDHGIDDDAVCEAIEWHTTGRPGLGPVGLALYYADYAEPLRTHPQAT